MANDSRARIRHEAAELLSRDGYNGMGLKALSEATGLPAGSIYHHFPGGKDEIAATAIVETADAVAQLLEALLVDGVTDDAVSRMFTFMADRLEATDFVAGCVVGTPALDDATPAPRVLGACGAGFERLAEPIVDAFVREGRFAGRRQGHGHDPAQRLRRGHRPGPGAALPRAAGCGRSLHEPLHRPHPSASPFWRLSRSSGPPRGAPEGAGGRQLAFTWW